MTPIEIILQSMHDSGLDDPTTEDAKAALTALSEAGWSLVPSEATEEMTGAGIETGPIGCCNIKEGDAKDLYKAMIEAGAYKV